MSQRPHLRGCQSILRPPAPSGLTRLGARCRAVRVVLLGGALTVAPLASACSSPDPGNVQPKSVTGDERDTEMKHEPCDTGAPGATKVDVNSDGRPDIIHVMNAGREVCRVADLNLDGAVDVFIYYDPQGFERRRESDFDRDGRADEIAHLQSGIVFRKERETNFDNKLDTWDYYAGGRLVRRERDSDGDAIIDQWWQFNNAMAPRCAIVAADRNSDGRPDPESVVDLCAESYGAAPGAASPVFPPAPFPGGARPVPGAPSFPLTSPASPGAPQAGPPVATPPAAVPLGPVPAVPAPAPSSTARPFPRPK